MPKVPHSNTARFGLFFLVFTAVICAQVVATPLALRMITVATRSEASEIRAQIEDGTPFDQMAIEHSIDTFARDGGYIGVVRVQDLRPILREALEGLAPGETSVVVEVDGQHVLLQILSPDERSWREENEQARTALGERRLAEAEAAFTRALDIAESFGPADFRLAQTLNNLGAVYYESGELEQAEQSFERAVSVTEAAFGAGHPDVANALQNLADVQLVTGRNDRAEVALRRALEIREASDGPRSATVALTASRLAVSLESRGSYSEAAELLQRSLSILEESAAPDEPQTAKIRMELGIALAFDETRLDQAEEALRQAHRTLEATYGPSSSEAVDALQKLSEVVYKRGAYEEAVSISETLMKLRWGRSDDPLLLLDKFTELLSLDTFRGDEFDRVLESFLAGAADSSLSGNLYLSMGDILAEANMSTEAVMLMEAIRPQFSSRLMEYEFAEALAAAGQSSSALTRFQKASEMQPVVALSPEEDAAELSRIFRRIGDMAFDVSELDVAGQAYDKAIDLDENNLSAQSGRARLNLVLGRTDDALAGYSVVLDRDPESIEAHYGRAEALFQKGDFSGVVEAADRVLDENPDYTKALFLRGSALLRSGKTKSGQSDLGRYERAQESARSAEQSNREIFLVLDNAGHAFVDGAPDQAVAFLRDGIAQHPSALPLHLSLGVALTKLNRTQEAIEAFERVIMTGLNDDFVLHYQLSKAYSTVGDEEQALRHRDLYLARVIAQIEKRSN